MIITEAYTRTMYPNFWEWCHKQTSKIIVNTMYDRVELWFDANGYDYRIYEESVMKIMELGLKRYKRQKKLNPLTDEPDQ